MGARWYDGQISRWVSPDTIIPDPTDPQSLDRFSYVRNDPVNLIDPSGFCEGTAGDHPTSEDACWTWIAQIEQTYSNITIDPPVWIAEELEAVWKALAFHVFIEDILSADSITLHRRRALVDRQGGIYRSVGGMTSGANGTYEISLYDAAYHIPPDANEWQAMGSVINFEAAVIHELAHVALGEDPFLLWSYQARSSFPSGDINDMLFRQVALGISYPFVEGRCFASCRDGEFVAISASVWQLSPDTFKMHFLFWQWSDWRESWLGLFWAPNPLVQWDYGPTTIGGR